MSRFVNQLFHKLACSAKSLEGLPNKKTHNKGHAEQVKKILPEVGEPLDQLCGIVLIESDVREEHLENRRGRISDIKEHQLCLSKVHRSQSTV